MKRQRGVTFVGMVFIAGLIVFGAIIGIKLVPAYIEYATITNHLRELANGPEGRGGNNAEIISGFRKRAQVDDIRSVPAEDLSIEKDGNTVLITAAYSTKIKLFGNLSACLDFEASSK
jgi:Tfp pilus assembly major pilin PilA